MLKTKLLLAIFLYINILSNNNVYSQNIDIEGYVIRGKEICPDVLIIVLNKNVSTYSNRNGKFKISCQINDTLNFDTGKKNIPLTYVVKDSSFVIFELSYIQKGEYDCNSRRPYSSKYQNYFNSYNIQYSSLLNKSLFHSVGFSFIRTLNKDILSYNLGSGINYYKSDFNNFLFPFISLKFDLRFRNIFLLRNNYLILGFPECKFGYSVYSPEYQNNNRFGIIISSNFLKFHLPSFHVKMNVSFEKLNSDKGVFALGLNLSYHKYKNYNDLKRRIKFINY